MVREAVTWTILNQGSMCRVDLPPSESIQCKSNAVVSMSNECDVQAGTPGGLCAGLARHLFTRQSFSQTELKNTLDTVGDAILAPWEHGGLALHLLVDEPGADMLIAKGAYFASDKAVLISSELQSHLGSSLIAKTGFFVLRAHGHGTVALAAHGSVHQCDLGEGEFRKIDNGHVVAWTACMAYKTCLASRGGGLWGSWRSGEGFMCEFQGPGTVYVQSHTRTFNTQPERRSLLWGVVAYVFGTVVRTFAVFSLLIFFLLLLIIVLQMRIERALSVIFNSLHYFLKEEQFVDQLPAFLGT